MSMNDATARRLRWLIERLLIRDPSAHLSDVARSLQIDRHTVEESFSKAETTFRQVRAQIRLRVAERARRKGASAKAIAIQLGYTTTRAYSRFIRAQRAARTPEM